MGITRQQAAPVIEQDRPETGYGQRLHNRPPLDEEIKVEFKDQLAQRDGLMERHAQVIAAAERAEAYDDDTFGRCGELVKQIRAVGNVINDTHKAVKEPYLAASRAIDGARNDLVRPLEDAKALVEDKQRAYAREKQQRLDAERRQREAEERARIAEERAKAEAEGAIEDAAAPPPAPQPLPETKPEMVRGTFGAAVSTSTVARAVIVDYELAFMAVSSNIKVREAIDKAIAAMVRAGQHEIPGVRVEQDVKVSNR